MTNGVDYSVFYYTYSTIAQTLASAFGFLLAIVLYRTQASEKLFLSTMKAGIRKFNLAMASQEIRITSEKLEDLKINASRQEYDEILKFILRLSEQWKTGNNTQNPDLLRLYIFLGPQRDYIVAVKTRLAKGTYATMATIAYCLVAMPLTNSSMMPHACVAWMVLAPAVLLSLSCVYAYGRLAIATIGLLPRPLGLWFDWMDRLDPNNPGNRSTGSG